VDSSRKLVTPAVSHKEYCLPSIPFLPPTPSSQHRAMCTRSVRISPSISSPCFLSVATVGPGVRTAVPWSTSSVTDTHSGVSPRFKTQFLQCLQLFPWLGPRLDERRHDTIVVCEVLGGIGRIGIITPIPTHSPCPSLSRPLNPRNKTQCMDPVNVSSPPRSPKTGLLSFKTYYTVNGLYRHRR
jgi:hypothetical protein